MAKKTGGWFGESLRHSLSARGLHTFRKSRKKEKKPVYREIKHLTDELDGDTVVLTRNGQEFTKDEIVEAIHSQHEDEEHITLDHAEEIFDYFYANKRAEMDDLFWWTDQRGVPVPSPDALRDTMEALGIHHCMYCDDAHHIDEMGTSSEGYPICEHCEEGEE